MILLQNHLELLSGSNDDVLKNQHLLSSRFWIVRDGYDYLTVYIPVLVILLLYLTRKRDAVKLPTAKREAWLTVVYYSIMIWFNKFHPIVYSNFFPSKWVEVIYL